MEKTVSKRVWGVLSLACLAAAWSACSGADLDDEVAMSGASPKQPISTPVGRSHGRDAGPGHCGDGAIQAREVCDPAAHGWEMSCDDSCRRTSYEKCQVSSDCPGLNALCAGYDSADSLFCADYCEADEACPTLPGFQSVCNFAWCAVRCKGGHCPPGMTCAPHQKLLGRDGQDRGTGDICVPVAEED